MPPKLFGGGGDATVANQTSMEAKIDIINANVQTLVERAQCDVGMAASATTIDCADLADYGEDYFNLGWKMCILYNYGTPGAAPESEWRDITNYVTATGIFTVAAFSADVHENDYIMVARDEFVNASMRLEHQTPIHSDTSPAQNAWVIVANLSEPGVIHRVGMCTETTVETLELEMTVDGVLYTDAQVDAVANTVYYGIPITDSAGAYKLAFTLTTTAGYNLNLPYRTLLLRVRKTTALGANPVNGYLMYSKYVYG